MFFFQNFLTLLSFENFSFKCKLILVCSWVYLGFLNSALNVVLLPPVILNLLNQVFTITYPLIPKLNEKSTSLHIVLTGLYLQKCFIFRSKTLLFDGAKSSIRSHFFLAFIWILLKQSLYSLFVARVHIGVHLHKIHPFNKIWFSVTSI